MKRCLTILIGFLIAASGLSARADTPSSLTQLTGTPLCDSFYSFLAESKQSTIDSFLRDLMRRPEFANGISAKAAMYHSRAKHGSTLQDPRALVMFGMGDLVLAFNGAKDEAFYDTLEMMCFNRTVGRFEFRAIQFASEAQPNSVSLDEIEMRTPSFNVTRTNPTACAECHGTSYVKPVWETYLAWAGSFGSYEEAFALPRARFAREAHQTEYTNLSALQKQASLNMGRYRNFSWGGQGPPNLTTVNDALFGILVNYKMSNPAIRQATHYLKQPANAKYKYAFAGYMLGCSTSSFLPHDSAADLDAYMTNFLSQRAGFELTERVNLNQDLANVGETLTWFDAVLFPQNLDPAIADLSRVSTGIGSMVIRTALVSRAWLFKLARLENLYNKMSLSTTALHLGDSKTSWDGYNEIQDYMSDYLLKYYNLPLITPVQKRQVETNGPRADLDTVLSNADYASAYQGLADLQLPTIQNGDKAQLCADLSKASLALFSTTTDK